MTFDEAQSILLVGGGLYWRTGGNLVAFDYGNIYESNLRDQRDDVALFIHLNDPV